MSNIAILFDFGNHYKQIKHANFLYSTKYKVKVCCFSSQKEKYLGVLDKDDVLVINSFRSICLFVFYLFYAKLLCILTGPHYFSRLKKVFCFNAILFVFVIRFLIGKLNYYYIKDIRNYLPSSFLTKMILFFSDKVMFESNTLKRVAVENHVVNAKYAFTSFVYYSDVEQVRADELVDSIFDKNRHNVAVIGQFNLDKRNYGWLDTPTIHSFYLFIQVGKCLESQVKRVCCNKLVFVKDDFTDDELNWFLSKSNFMLSLNSENFGYEKYKGTAAFGEAISLKKALVIPSFCDPDREFSDFCFYFDDEASFLTALINASKFEIMSDNIFSKYSISSISDRIL